MSSQWRNERSVSAPVGLLRTGCTSAKHAVVSFADGEWWLEDAGSTNGTLLNGTRVWEKERLHYGDLVQVGRIALRLERVL